LVSVKRNSRCCKALHTSLLESAHALPGGGSSRLKMLLSKKYRQYIRI
jgi:hypothetical protein